MANGNGKGKGKGGNGKPKPKAPARPRRPAPPSTIVRARNQVPAGLPVTHHFNAFNSKVPQALAFSVGPATHVCGAKRFSGSLSTGQLRMHMFQFTGGYNQYTGYYSNNAGDSWAQIDGGVSPQTIDSTGITLTAGAGSPNKVMMTRGSVKLRVYTKALNLEGLVRVLRISSAIPDINNADLYNLFQYISGHIRTRTYTNQELTQTHQWDAIPTDQASYMTFRAPSSGISNIAEPALSTIVFLQESVTEVQSYEFGMGTTGWARYSEVGPLASMAVHPPTLPQPIINAIRDKAEALGSAASAVGTAVVKSTQAVGKAAWAYQAIKQMKNMFVPEELAAIGGML